MHIGIIAKATGATARAIRLYESMGLLTDVRRRGAYRIYSAEHVQLVKWIRQAQELGFRLSELGTLQGAIDAPAWAQIAAMIDAKREGVVAEIGRLSVIEQRLSALSDELRSCETLRAPASACEK